MRILNLFLALLFVAFALVQLNDPDPVFWIFIYSAVAVISALSIFRIYPVIIIWFLIVINTIYMAYLFPGILSWLAEEEKSIFFNQMQNEKAFIEESREFIGLLLAVLTLLFHYFSYSRYKKTAAP
jgi:hypothetical protein